nr:hypothetical protein CFP56_61802 [Quercus suber]
MPSPTQPTGAALPAPPLPPTDGADAGDWSLNGLLMPVRCIHWIREPETDFLPNQIDTICMSLSEIDVDAPPGFVAPRDPNPPPPSLGSANPNLAKSAAPIGLGGCITSSTVT